MMVGNTCMMLEDTQARSEWQERASNATCDLSK